MNLIALYFRLLIRFLRFFAEAKTRYDLHSPYLFRLAEEVIEDRREFYTFPVVDKLRSKLLADERIVQRLDFGAGSKIRPGKTDRTVRDIAHNSAVSPQSGKFLFRQVQFFHPKAMLELGTSLGISSAYQAGGAIHTPFYTIEGCPQTAAIADANFRTLNLPHVHLLVGTFSDQLPIALQALQKVDYIYLDGDHREGATLQYLNTCLPYLAEEALIVVADIYWSDEMEKAWEQMRQHPKVRFSVDVFHFGLLFFRPTDDPPVHLKLVPARWKPWRF
ncbi:MAG TPA: class I SAM-dependent methyltransferase [Saprospiraceae bacterium]|nr:class I SAM-dependent methyltransferase [Saprospiraceae bacterium]HMQ85637.1 class I SAM-dependent methyltransferase [Saprospiraceae bacterium]